MKGLTKEHLCTTCGRENNMGIHLGRGEGEAGWRWGKGEKAGTTVTAKTIKIKLKKN